MRNWLMHLARVGMVAGPLAVTAACHGVHHDDGIGFDPESGTALANPHVCGDPTMMALARDLDHLEKHIDWFGSVTAKVPDIWGQARLTQYREEFESQMKGDLGSFRETLQGSIARSDQSYFAQAVALSAAVSGTAATTTTPAGVIPSNESTATTQETKSVITAPTLPALPPGVGGGGSGNTLEPATFFKDSDKFVTQTFTSTLKVPGTGTNGPLAIGLEPTVVLEQKARYLNYLNQIRRVNEGDDTADSPGYSLNLIRIPMSVLPGKRTDVGFGAEVTMTLAPVLGDDLLPMTFRRFVVNDLVDQLGFPLTVFLDEERIWASSPDPDDQYLTKANRNELQRLEAQAAATGEKVPTAAPPVIVPQAAGVPPVIGGLSPKAISNQVAMNRLANTKSTFAKPFVSPRLSFANGLNGRYGYPSSQLLDVLGVRFAFEIAFGAQEALGREITKVKYVHLPDVQSYLREELQAAYLFLAEPANIHLWNLTPGLATLIHNQQWEKLADVRSQYRDMVQALTGSKPLYKTDAAGKPLWKDGVIQVNDPGETRQVSKTAALAWAILVDAALLNARLVRDMKETASSKGQSLAGCDPACPYYLPNPPSDCRSAFNAYVALRWPIHVFALDPATQDQNLADAFASRRETQLALSLAFVSGQISANSLTRFARRLEAQYDTIALNRTQVGFGHGENVFGWRFYPRFQTPDTESNLTVLVRDQLIGGPNRNALLRQRRLEPGPRECVAIVMMPSFVPYVSVDTVSNWFPLANPKHKVLDHTQAMRLSRTVQAVKTDGAGVRDAACYRDGEFRRLQVRVGQLESRLPTQTLTSPVPILNTLGGFEMFSNGTTDLAPELYGWYGAPGLDPKKETTLFLVGDHFSPLRTKVLVGNVEIPDVPTEKTLEDGTKVVVQPGKKMLSRQVMQVTVPAGAYMIDQTADGAKVRVHVATPYGVTRELEIPVPCPVKPCPEPKPKEPAPVPKPMTG